MPRCKNIPDGEKPVYYKGTEKTPRGYGLCAKYESGKSRKGTDGLMYLSKNGRWVRIKKMGNRKGFFEDARKSKLWGYYNKENVSKLSSADIIDMPNELILEIFDNLDCKSILSFSQTSKKFREILKFHIYHIYNNFSNLNPTQFPPIEEDISKDDLFKIFSLSCGEYLYPPKNINYEDTHRNYDNYYTDKQIILWIINICKKIGSTFTDEDIATLHKLGKPDLFRVLSVVDNSIWVPDTLKEIINDEYYDDDHQY